jgi:hypothetical protein
MLGRGIVEKVEKAKDPSHSGHSRTPKEESIETTPPLPPIIGEDKEPENSKLYLHQTFGFAVIVPL